MSIITSKNYYFYLILAKFLGYFLLCTLLFLVVSIFSPSSKIAHANCYASSIGCTSFGDNYFPLSDQSQCSLDNFSKGYVPLGTICCCSKISSSATKPKYILISSVIAFFAILTGLVFFYKKNE
jgi:hypothetical protein